ncbi:MAPEG family protein [Sphingomonas cavernae]|uniref:MAPEG family protein n=1 Tax=Sphingomonas cavernae TaxID=2320861 RepID=A0A418W6B0_9SPHN|nr:MAPEG family protein [Sphingomonas cavernae]RJF85508.1 MAPEG family protein [Sphingomonas cavernae]
MQHSPILGAVVALVGWSLVMWLWMYATRLPAMQKAKVVLDPTLPPKALTEGLPATVRWKADNYNHLMEQPTLFYAIALTLAIVGAGDGLTATIAWGYVVLRIIHSLVQALVNNIMVRFSVFVLSTLCLIALTLHAAMAVWGH